MEQKNKFIYILPVMFGFFIMGFVIWLVFR